MSNYSHKDSVKTIVDLHHQAADNFAEKIDTTKLDRNHMYPVNMYYGKNANRASSHTTDFYEMGIKNDTLDESSSTISFAFSICSSSATSTCERITALAEATWSLKYSLKLR